MKDEKAAIAVEEEVLPNIQDMSGADRAAFLKDGTLPTKSEGTAKAEATSGAESEPAIKEEPAEEEQRPGKSRYQRRIDRLTAQVKELEARLGAKPGVEPRTETATAQSTSKAPKLKSFTDQIGAKYESWEAAHEAFDDAKDAYYEQRRVESVAEALKAERTKLQQVEAQQSAEKIVEKNAKTFAKRAEEFRATLPDDNFVAHFIEVKEAIDEAMAERPEMGKLGDRLIALEEGPQIIHYLGQNAEVLDQILELSLEDALFELGKLAVSDKIKAPTPKTKTSAKRIAPNVAGANASSTDPEWEAANKNDISISLKADPNFAKRRGAAW